VNHYSRRFTIGTTGATPPNRELVIYALFLLGGETERVHTEDLALKCFELFPGSFSWAKYPQYPDKDIVRVALTDARKSKHGGLVEGRAGQRRGLITKTSRQPAEDGWTLTLSGVQWIRENLELLEGFAGSAVVKQHRQKILRRLKRIREHSLFVLYEDSPGRFHPMIGDIADMLRCRVDAEPEVWVERFSKLRREAESAGQADLIDFTEKCQRAYLDQR